jgi:hypothetical protein
LLARCQAGFERLQLLEAYGGLVQGVDVQAVGCPKLRAAGSAGAAALTDLDQIVVALVTEYTSPLEKQEQPGD